LKRKKENKKKGNDEKVITIKKNKERKDERKTKVATKMKGKMIRRKIYSTKQRKEKKKTIITIAI
jgi:hypothetical protein